MVWDKYQNMMEGKEGDDASSLDMKYAGDVIRLIGVFKGRYMQEGTVGFAQSFDRIELLSPGLTRDA